MKLHERKKKIFNVLLFIVCSTCTTCLTRSPVSTCSGPYKPVFCMISSRGWFPLLWPLYGCPTSVCSYVICRGSSRLGYCHRSNEPALPSWSQPTGDRKILWVLVFRTSNGHLFVSSWTAWPPSKRRSGPRLLPSMTFLRCRQRIDQRHPNYCKTFPAITEKFDFERCQKYV